MALSKEKVKDIKLIFKQNADKFIPKIWVHRTFPNGYTHNHSVHIWSLDCIQHVQYSLHFVCYLAKFIMKPTCCDPTVKEVGVTWMNNLLDTSFNAGYTFPRAQRLERFLYENTKTVDKINLKLTEIKEEISPNETVFSKLDSIPTSLEPSQEKLCFTCGELKMKTRTCESCIQHNIIIMEIIHRPECWTCLTPSLYISHPITVNPLKVFVFTIDLKKKCVMMGWEKRLHRIYNLRQGVGTGNSEHEVVQQNRPLSIMWSALDVFEECSARIKTPSLSCATKFYVLSNFNLDKVANYIPKLVLKDMKSMEKTFKKFTTFEIC